jgi:hypothetical protein
VNTPLDTLLAVAGIGGRLGIADDKLRMLLPGDCHPELKDAIRRNKSGLLELLRLNFLLVRSDALGVTVFWTTDDATKDDLVAAGATPGNIYTSAELAQLVARRVTAGELPAIHAAKQRFSGKVTEP